MTDIQLEEVPVVISYQSFATGYKVKSEKIALGTPAITKTEEQLEALKKILDKVPDGYELYYPGDSRLAYPEQWPMRKKQ